VGDINGSYVPVGDKELSFLNIIDREVVMVPVNEPFIYNIHSSRDACLGAMTLFMGYDQDRVEVTGIANTPEGMKFVAGDGRIAVAWSDTKPLMVKADDLLFSLNMRVKEKLSEPSQVFTIRAGSEFADIYARPFENFDLKIAKITAAESLMEISLYNYPNPFRNTTTIVYSLPESGYTRLVLTDMYGKTIHVLTGMHETAGSHTLTLDPAGMNLTPGIYLCKIIVEGSKDNYYRISKMMFIR
jgi:hypothetical protein